MSLEPALSKPECELFRHVALGRAVVGTSCDKRAPSLPSRTLYEDASRRPPCNPATMVAATAQ